MNWKLIRIIDTFLGIPIIRLLMLLSPPQKGSWRQKTNLMPKRILLIKFWGIGNLFMLLPAIHALRATLPNSDVDFLTLESNRDALAMTGAVNDIATIDTRTPYVFLKTWRRVTAQLRLRRYDLIIDFEQFARFSALLTHQIKSSRSIGFATSGQHRHRLYTDSVPYDNDIHITRSFYALVEKAGVTLPFSPSITLPAVEKLKTKGSRILANLNIAASFPVAVMHIGTSDNFRERRWPPHSYAALAELLSEQYGMRVILTGLPDEAFLIAETMQYLTSAEKIIDLGGRLSFEDYFALITAADLVISADTAAVHMASAVNTPVVGLYGPNSPDLYGPWGKSGLALYAGFSCSPCITNFNSKINTCRHPDGRGACMKALTVEETFAEIERTFCTPQAPHRLAKLAGLGA